jgi:hypothetical protein
VRGAVSSSPHIAGDGAWTVENKEDRIRSAAAAPPNVKTSPRKNNVQTKT